MKFYDLIARLDSYQEYLIEAERCSSTRQQYLRDVTSFLYEVSDKEVGKEAVIQYKEAMCERYKPSSINVKLAAINGFLEHIGFGNLKVRHIRIQRNTFCDKRKELSRADYMRLIKTAEGIGDERLSLLIQTIGATGIRVSELRYITCKAIQDREVVIQLKGKTRLIMIPGKICKKLMRYAKRNKIKEGPLFLSKKGNPMDRTNIWRLMKKLCGISGVEAAKVFPHNLRHLFAKCFYNVQKDIAKLADVLGHSSIETTRIYITSSGEEHRRQLEGLRLII